MSERVRKTRGARNDVYEKTKGMCWYCGTKLGDRWHVDHQHPFLKGGTDDLSNLVPSCRKCNLNKGALAIEEYRQAVSINPFAKFTTWQIQELNRLDDNKPRPSIVFYGEKITHD